MRNTLFLIVIVITAIYSNAVAQYDYAANKQNPYGILNPSAPTQVADYAKLIGLCDCKSVSRKPYGTWAEPIDMIWTFKYVMNGTAVQDETLKADGKHSGSMRFTSRIVHDGMCIITVILLRVDSYQHGREA